MNEQSYFVANIQQVNNLNAEFCQKMLEIAEKRNDLNQYVNYELIFDRFMADNESSADQLDLIKAIQQ